MRGIHFGAGNIGRGFIGEILHKNQMIITFVDIDKDIIQNLNDYGQYTIKIAGEGYSDRTVSCVQGVNGQTDPQAVIDAFSDADLVTTAVGPNILPHIAQHIAAGLVKRYQDRNTTPLDIIACENMIRGSSCLRKYVLDLINDIEVNSYIDQYVGFPDAAVDRIVPLQSHDSRLTITVEPYSEWIVNEFQMKRPELKLSGVQYTEDLRPYIERKLFTVNTGHATIAYHGWHAGYTYIHEALKDEKIYQQVQGVLNETGQLLCDKWGFDVKEHQQYSQTTLDRFANQYLEDKVVRVGRGPIRKASYNDRFVKPIRECYDRLLPYTYLVNTVSKLFAFDIDDDAESVLLQDRLSQEKLEQVIQDVTGIGQVDLIEAIVEQYKHKGN